MGFIKNLIDGLKRSNDQQYIDTITYQSQKLDEYKKKIDEILISLEGRNKNKVFNLTGTVPSGGHSFGGYLDDNNSMWIIECTAKSPIIKMKGSKYKCNSSLKGITNWMCAGIPKVEQFE